MGLSFSWSVLIPVTFGSVQLSSTSPNRNKALTRVLKIIYIWTHESVLAVVTAPPDLIKRWPEWSWRGHSCLIKAFLICWCLFDSTKIADRFCQCLLSHVSHSCVFFYFCFVFLLIVLFTCISWLHIYLLASDLLQCRKEIMNVGEPLCKLHFTECTNRWITAAYFTCLLWIFVFFNPVR